MFLVFGEVQSRNSWNFNAHPTIKFTAGYRTRGEDVKVKWDKDSGLLVIRTSLGSLKPRSIDFLDTTVWIDEMGKFQTDLFVKETSTHFTQNK